MQPDLSRPRVFQRNVLFAILPALAFLLASIALTYASAAALSPQVPLAGNLTVTIIGAPNLVVDSNVLSPSTYAPSVATVSGKFCNTGNAPLTSVYGYIGDNLANTPGLYPSRNCNAGPCNTQHPHLSGSGTYALAHVGGRTGRTDATRYIGTLAVGACSYQYWHFTYPRRENPNNTGPDPVWGITHDPNDDLWLTYDVWGTSSVNNPTASKTVTMRNEISAMANKIRPNPDGVWFNTDTSNVRPGQVITSNGVYYEFGVANQGFDNDGDFVPDYNAWAQPIGDPAYDPSCFRLIRTSGVISVSRSAMPDLIIPFTDRLYFQNLPTNNNGIRGNVYYTFLAMSGSCSVGLSPYQEVASGYQNEKFNGDYGTGIPPIVTLASTATMDKTSAPASVALGGTVSYQMQVGNTGTFGLGMLNLSSGINLPAVISDSIPTGMTYVGASASLTIPYVNTGYTVLYSTNGGLTWTNVQPAPLSSITTLQWWLNDPIPASQTVTANFQATAPGVAPANPFITNTACVQLGGGAPLACDPTVTMIQGNSNIGDTVWKDDGTGAGGAPNDGIQNGTEAGIPNVTVRLYWDSSGNGTLDSTDTLVNTAVTNGSGVYNFPNLPAGAFADFIAEVDNSDPDLPVGYSITTARRYSFLNLVAATSYLTADFGYGPILTLLKSQSPANPVLAGTNVTYTLALRNNRPGDGSALPNFCKYTVYATIDFPTNSAGMTPPGGGPANAQFQNTPNIRYAPDNAYTNSGMNNNPDKLGVSGFNKASQGGNITNVKALLYARERVDFRASDTMDYQVWFNDVAIGTAFSYDGTTLPTAAMVDFTLSNDVTALRAWTWADFSGDITDAEMQVNGNAGGGSPNGEVDIDAAAFIITTDQLCGDSSDTIVTQPLTDTFDGTLLQFVSASVTPDSITTIAVPYTTTKLLTWNNVGPIYGGGTKTVIVVLKALMPPDTNANGEPDPASTINRTRAAGGVMGDGRSANPAVSQVTTTINPSGTIGDTIWNDNGNGGGTANNGIQDGGEAGIAGVTVTISGSAGASCNPTACTAVTDANGKYLFEGLLNGTYTVVVNTASLPGTTFTQRGDPDQPGIACSVCDNQAARVINTTDGLSTNDKYLNIDFGYSIPNVIKGYVWEDKNGDGIWNVGEPPISGVTITIAGPGCTPLLCTLTTDANGYYESGNLPGGGTYTVTVSTGTLPGGVTWTQTFDPDSACPSGGCNSATTTPAVAGGNIYGPYNFGYRRSGTLTIGDTLYKDWNSDGTQNATTEEGIANVTVYLYEDDNGNGVIDASDAIIATTTTNASGVYTFASLAAGNYIVKVDRTDVDLPSSYAETQDPDEAGVCAICNAQGKTTLVAANVLTLDFGFRPLGSASIGDFVWRDVNHNGAQDGGAETGIANITVNLYQDDNGNGVLDASDAFIGTTTTNANGLYSFTNLAAGNYLVDINTLDVDLPLDGNALRYVLSTNNDPHQVTLTTGQAYTLADFGFTPGGLIGDRLWQDANQDGMQDQSENPIPNVTVTLYVDVNNNGVYDAGTDTLYGTTSTDVNGLYEFKSLPAGNYVVVVDTADPQLPSTTVTGDPDILPPCPNGRPSPYDCGSRNNQTGVSLAPGQIDRSRDFGFATPGVIGDTIWYDMDSDGVIDPGETRLEGVTVTLTGPGCAPCTTVTDSAGYYVFSGLANGAYLVTVTAPVGMTQVYDPDSVCPSVGCNNASNSTITLGSTDLTRDFGYRYAGPFSISGTVFFDVANNGGLYILGTDMPYQGITVYLWDANKLLIGTTTTDAAGLYTFPNLPNGNYTTSINPNAPEFSLMTINTPGGGLNYYNPVTIAGANVTQKDFGLYGDFDFGDLPASYNASALIANGPRHKLSTLFLGAGVSGEANTRGESVNANLDTNDDGVNTLTGVAWSVGANGGRINVIATGGAGFVSAWIDWNNDGDFNDSGERILLDKPVVAGTQLVTFPIPTGTTLTNTAYNIRVRLYDTSTAGTASYMGAVSNGEVEDYHWPFGPTAVSLNEANITATTTSGAHALGLLALTVLSALLFFTWKKRQG